MPSPTSVQLLERGRRLARLVNRELAARVGVRIVRAGQSGLDEYWFNSLFYFDRLLGLIEDVPGNVVECGVASGGTLGILASAVRARRVPRHVWGFDCWTGLPAPTPEDLSSDVARSAQGFFACAPEKVLDTLRNHGFTDRDIQTHVTLRQGYFADSLPPFAASGPEIALLHLDVDLYQSYIDCLTYLWPRLKRGGIVALDEYHLPRDWPGAKQAVDEFVSRLPSAACEMTRDPQFGKYYLVKME